MSKNLEIKKAAVEEIKERFSTAKSAVLVDYRGLTVEEVTALRAKFREAGVEYKVYKNNMVKLAIKDTDFEPLSQDLTGPNAIAFGIEDAVIPAKIIKDTPLPIPLSVISSPIHIKNTVPAVTTAIILTVSNNDNGSRTP